MPSPAVASSRTIYVILPAYDEAAVIGALLRRLAAASREQARPCHVVLVDDASTDGTADAARRAADGLTLTVLTHSLNRGLWETVRDGFEWVGAHAHPDDAVVRMDADDTHDPAQFASMLSRLDAGADVVIASRYAEGSLITGLSAWRRFVGRVANTLLSLVFPIGGVRDYSCGYRAYRAGVIQEALAVFGNSFIDLRGVGFTCTVEKLLRMRQLGARFDEVPLRLHYERKRGPSKMLTGITTLGYFVLILKFIYPWGETGRRWRAARLARGRRA